MTRGSSSEADGFACPTQRAPASAPIGPVALVVMTPRRARPARLERAHSSLRGRPEPRVRPCSRPRTRSGLGAFEGGGARRRRADDRGAAVRCRRRREPRRRGRARLRRHQHRRDALAEACGDPARGRALRPSSQRVEPVLLELPPLVAAEIQLRLLVHLGIATEVSLWRTPRGARRVPCSRLGAGRSDRCVRAEAKAALAARQHAQPPRRSSSARRSCAASRRHRGAIVARGQRRRVATSRRLPRRRGYRLSPMLERELLLERADGA